jgi:hypothetical protein
MNSPYQRGVVNGEGLGDLEGFNPGKAFKRLITIKKSSFKLKNIAGSIGSAVSFAGTGGMSSILAPKVFGAHSKVMRVVGGVAVVAGIAAAAVFSGGAILAALPALLPTTLGGALAATASGLSIATTGMSLLGKKKSDGSNYSQQEVVAAQAAYDQSQQGLLAAQQGQQQEKAQLEYRQQLNEQSNEENIQEEPYYPTPVSEQLDKDIYDTMPDEGMSGMGGIEFMGKQWTIIELGLVGIAGWYFLSQSKSSNH